MRLTDNESRIIRDTVRRRFGSDARVWLFGSRADDAKRGGDIDLLVEAPAPLENAFRESIGLETDLQIALGDQKIDILLAQPNVPRTPMQRIARDTGIEL
ncbi:MAG: nucleotidyltransferase domain-containing protein [Azoarcus sp.]|nr:nucleotidyltransferase domain-containing protein [Azoarcus sp.]